MSYLKNGADHYCPQNTRMSRRMSGHQFTLLPIAFFITVNFSPVQAAELYFNPRFLSDDPSAMVDLSMFENGLEVAPGNYRVDIYMNDRFVTTRDVNFQPAETGNELMPCLTRQQYSTMGVNTASVPGMERLADDECVPLKTLIKDATIHFDVGQQRLYFTVPQIFTNMHARGYIPPELWDNGITAGLLNYNFTGNNVNSRAGGDSNYAYLNLQGGLNFGAWRLRDNSTWSYSSGTNNNENKWQHINTYLERDIIPLRSRLTLGDSYTSNEIFDGLNFRGVQLASNDNMLPDSQRGFAPVIHGIARGTAQVSIKQNGYEIYQSTVPPGPFTINDLYAAGNNGDLQVTVKEADGSVQVFSVPYSSVPLLQREGHTRYALTAGKFRSGNRQQEKPAFAQGTLLRGLTYGWTAYGGTQLADRYNAFNIGLGKNMGVLGALSLDITQANSTLPDDSKHQGQSIRFLYNKSLNELGTNLQLVGYRYSTRGYFNFSDTAYNRMSGYNIVTQDGVIRVAPKYTDYYNLAYSKRGRVQLSVTQQIDRQMTLYLNGNHQSYWGTSKTDKQLQAGINATLNDINLNLSYSLTKSAWQDTRDQMLAFNVSIPFSHWMRSDSTSAWRHASASYNMTNALNGRKTNTVGLYGTLLEDNNLSYSVQAGNASGGVGTSGETGYAALNYRGSYANANVGYSHSDGYRQLYYGLSGGMVAHEDGVTLSQPFNNTAVLVKAPGANNVKVENQTGIRTDWRGYAVLPYAMDYRENRVALDTNTLADNVDLDDAVINVTPTHSAIVRAHFKANVGLKVLMSLEYQGKPVPFGAVVASGDHGSSSIVANNGQVYLTGLPTKGQVHVKWGNQSDTQCTATYDIPPESQTSWLTEVTAQCR
ncbi:fimbrial biogenesis usher protein [Samsonia erythrinae]|uniref:Outer membrane usher protein n=1 Tax=Samsonia erythrinae TaxID=160434 RepID=A0A4V2VT35_9GAMM|nr:fimbrial biogenesis usher protein [Samsonia erythrinae]TCV04750.1 outer membrane usher protein [Samsonia erythrinae]